MFGFYRNEEHGQEALREARKSGFRRSAVIHRAADGGLEHFHDGRGPRERAILGFALAICVAVATLSLNLPPITWPLLMVGCVLMLGGFLIGWFGTLWLGLGLRDRVLHGYRGLVLPGESMVAIEATEAEMVRMKAVSGRQPRSP